MYAILPLNILKNYFRDSNPSLLRLKGATLPLYHTINWGSVSNFNATTKNIDKAHIIEQIIPKNKAAVGEEEEWGIIC